MRPTATSHPVTTIPARSVGVLFATGSAAFLAGVAYIVGVGVSRSEGNFSYALDDAYIHMAMARNLWELGTWTLTSGVFTSASSSLLYPVVLWLAYPFKLAGPYVPLAVNLVAGVALIGVISTRMLGRTGQQLTTKSIALVALVMLVPLPTLAATGMEHVLHCLLSLLLVDSATVALERGLDKAHAGAVMNLALCAMLATACRYETLFLIIPVAGLLLQRRLVVTAATMVVCAAAPVLVWGALSLAHGEAFFPNSLLLKSAAAQDGGWRSVVVLIARPLHRLYQNPWLFSMVLVIAGLLLRSILRSSSFPDRAGVFQIVFLTATGIHLALAGVGWVFRYEAYLICIGLCGILLSVEDDALSLRRLREARIARFAKFLTLLIATALAYPLVFRAGEALYSTPLAMQNIWSNQHQVAQFLAEFYPGTAVGANDVGVLAYKGANPVLDMWGLGETEVLRAKRARRFTFEFLDSLARSRRVAVVAVYDDWFERQNGVRFATWTLVGQWHVENYFQPSGDLISWYAISDSSAGRLRRSLAAVSPQLPAGVRDHLLPIKDRAQ